MLITLLTEHPGAALDIVRQAPPWVWLLLAGLVALGLSQCRERRASLARVTVLPVAMALLSLVGLATAFAQSGALIGALGGALADFALAGGCCTSCARLRAPTTSPPAPAFICLAALGRCCSSSRSFC